MTRSIVDVELTVGDSDDGYTIELRALGTVLHTWGPFTDRQVAQGMLRELGERLREVAGAVTLH